LSFVIDSDGVAHDSQDEIKFVECQACGQTIEVKCAVGLYLSYLFGAFKGTEKELPAQTFVLCAECVTKGYTFLLSPTDGMILTKIQINTIETPTQSGLVTKLLVTTPDQSLWTLPLAENTVLGLCPPLENIEDEGDCGSSEEE
jgi:hypothetical protein